MTFATPIPGSFRDPSGCVHDWDGKIYRTVSLHGAKAYEAVRKTGFLDRMIEQGRVVGMREVRSPAILGAFPDAVHVLEHPRLKDISYPYEWCFQQLKDAAMHHLDLSLDALAADLTLSDATAYNIQFVGSKPVFIDHLSLRPYKKGEMWLAHNQFCEQFLNPLLLSAVCGISYNEWYRGRLEGIPTSALAKLLPVRSRLSFRMNAHIFLPEMLGRGNQSDAVARSGKKRKASLSRMGYEGLLRQLRNWIASLTPKDSNTTIWSDYADGNTYAKAERDAKRNLVRDFASRTRPSALIDLGCNSGDFSHAAIDAGAKRVIGYDFDQGALTAAWRRARAGNLPFLPLFLDAANPSPAQGWSQQERQGFEARAKGDAVIALAFIHHLAIGKNIGLRQAISWIVDRAYTGMIEFVPKSDPTVQAMLSDREDIFSTYTVDAFRAHLKEIATIENETEVSSTGRIIFEYRTLTE
ncbi:50S ribosomal protein L11 methyltransferase [Maribius pontilimi]|uniref:50S ribosomal protein L11 methyltransferase n=1 Tax=Palleronia pontilimi TaxID=1964209 RepID=A0A934IIF7_9RHOB|nr:class I SAM-dependent methyltransferase [Palleronia pontilimi]MBJ3762509.1 50S ribosomal protein L11 methyltransferase [Palleronia pontilimi]